MVKGKVWAEIRVPKLVEIPLAEVLKVREGWEDLGLAEFDNLSIRATRIIGRTTKDGGFVDCNIPVISLWWADRGITLMDIELSWSEAEELYEQLSEVLKYKPKKKGDVNGE